MNPASRTLMIVALLAAGGCAQKPEACMSSLNLADVVAAMGEGVAAQPVFAKGGVKGWRLYNTHLSKQLMAQGITPGALMTQVCGIPAREISAKGGGICCSAGASREVEVTINVADQERKVRINRNP
jgi:hypothetical protein